MIERVPCAIKLLKTPKGAASFHDFEEYERLVEAARGRSSRRYLRRAAGRRGGAAVRRDHGAGVDRRRLGQAATVRGAVRVEGPRHDAEGRAAAVRAADQAARQRRCGARGICADRGCSARRRAAAHAEGRPGARCDGGQAGEREAGVHILRHTFCSHLAMRGAPARAIQELAGHQDLATTQRYMHLSPAALDAAIRLLEAGQKPAPASVEK